MKSRSLTVIPDENVRAGFGMTSSMCWAQMYVRALRVAATNKRDASGIRYGGRASE
jgi:hypothetical protein